MKKVILYSLLFFLFLFIERQVSTFIGIPYNFLFRAVITYVFILCFCFIKKLSGKDLLLAFLFGFVIPDIIIRLLEDVTDALRTLPDQFLEILPAISAYYFYKSRQYLLTVFIAVSLTLFLVFFSAQWIQYVSYGNFNARVSEQVSGWTVYNQQNNTLNAADYKNKIVVFDVWNTGCPTCFNRFPILQTLYNKYKNNHLISIEALNIPLERDTIGMAFAVVKMKKFDFPVVVSANHLDSIFHVDAYPLVLVLHNNKIVFRGKIEDVEKAIQNINIKSMQGN